MKLSANPTPQSVMFRRISEIGTGLNRNYRGIDFEELWEHGGIALHLGGSRASPWGRTSYAPPLLPRTWRRRLPWLRTRRGSLVAWGRQEDARGCTHGEEGGWGSHSIREAHVAAGEASALAPEVLPVDLARRLPSVPPPPYLTRRDWDATSSAAAPLAGGRWGRRRGLGIDSASLVGSCKWYGSCKLICWVPHVNGTTTTSWAEMSLIQERKNIINGKIKNKQKNEKVKTNIKVGKCYRANVRQGPNPGERLQNRQI